MREFDRNKSLQQLEGQDWGEPTYDSRLVSECHRLRRVPLRRFSVEDLRVMIGQSIGLPYLVPLALEKLHRKPLAEGDYYAGDLLAAVLRAEPKFWHEHQDLRQDVQQIGGETLNRLRSLGHKKLATFRTTLDALNEAYELFTGNQAIAEPDTAGNSRPMRG
ncbi:MAG TPA: contact-dependent growth inhibition system immunity protein [Patescibacteria group bacterium]|jgi:hypothetical protein|nr:contact-dependent growth inhibition system immunity protein [Patescibacteria group bacterium]